MTYALIAYVIGHMAYHHFTAACFLYAVLACSLYFKRRHSLYIVLTLSMTLLGYGIDMSLHRSASVPKIHTGNQQLLVRYTALPTFQDDMLTIQAQTESGLLLVKSKVSSQIEHPSANFILNHQCLITGSFLPMRSAQQTPLFIANHLDFQQCQRARPTFKARLQYVKNKVIEHILDSRLSGKGEIIAIATGNTNYLDYETKLKAQKLGISHLFAISGTHITVLMMLFYSLGKRLPLPMFIVKFLLMLFLPCFLMFVGASPSAQRAVAMTLLMMMASSFYRLNALQALLIVYTTMSLFNSTYHYHLGFIYSFLIAAALIVMKDVLQQTPLVKSLLLGSYISVLVAIPINYVLTNEIQWQGLISNLFFIPFYSYIVIPLAFLISFLAMLFPFMLNFFVLLTHFIFSFQNTLLNSLSKLNHFPLIIPDFGEWAFFCCVVIVFLLLYLLTQKRYVLSMIIILSSCVFLWLVHPHYQNQMILIDVGQGDAILFLSETGETLLIDTGGVYAQHPRVHAKKNLTQATIYPLFKKLGIRHIDYLVITHAHQDHMGELTHLAEHLHIKNIIINPSHFDSQKFKMVKDVTLSEKAELYSYETISNIALGEFEFKFYNTDMTNSADPNEHSIITLARFHQTHILLMGDASAHNESLLLNRYQLPPIQILKVGHHGSQTSSDEQFITKIHPKIALISAGKHNIYHLPHPKTLEKLARVNTKVYNTADNHHIHILFTSNSAHPYDVTNERSDGDEHDK
ncbi:DNA internalization-related competence protein ComEC/Rec2 [Staphylococcus lutrae]|uniref:DNA internalization-related competence protein ComEC/Rec2 n=1 Tax=Staphylococcus lutrae TaxID=155085 RepID=A0AAC9RRD9_9STAP|nr:DNA internalization-related competence protein ComEC/Rec2 [Staphylococcus lutrae]ARJ49899.1 DNA internalization-related competence protein ComEC/Rec2 [Staphylococcus lutrae]PNZ38626.1 DNA internalization-related competence protein ComEC/Rec2 [Staphylococcus lutrae]